MRITVLPVKLDSIRNFREMFLHERNFQFVCNKCHDYGWADTWLFDLNGIAIGYGAVWGTDRREDRDTIFEFYLTKPYHKLADEVFMRFREKCGAIWVESQSNDLLLTSMLYSGCEDIVAEAMLFEDGFLSNLTLPGAIFRKRSIIDPAETDDNEYVISCEDQIVASGGLMLNYNVPYADVHMQVKEPFRQRGFGSFLVQELKRTAYQLGRIPAARCNIHNAASRATLLKAGFRTCGFRLKGRLK